MYILLKVDKFNMSNYSANITGSAIQGDFVQGSDSGNTTIILSNENSANDEKTVALEIQAILDSLSNQNPGHDLSVQMRIAANAIQVVESDKPLKQRIVSALKSGGTAAISQFLNHPASSFVVAALEDWNKSS
jgi:hypothetical protein